MKKILKNTLLAAGFASMAITPFVLATTSNNKYETEQNASVVLTPAIMVFENEQCPTSTVTDIGVYLVWDAYQLAEANVIDTEFKLNNAYEWSDAASDLANNMTLEGTMTLDAPEGYGDETKTIESPGGAPGTPGSVPNVNWIRWQAQTISTNDPDKNAFDPVDGAKYLFHPLASSDGLIHFTGKPPMGELSEFKLSVNITKFEVTDMNGNQLQIDLKYYDGTKADFLPDSWYNSIQENVPGAEGTQPVKNEFAAFEGIDNSTITYSGVNSGVTTNITSIPESDIEPQFASNNGGTSGGGMSTGTIVGITLGTLAGVSLLGVGGWFYYSKRVKK